MIRSEDAMALVRLTYTRAQHDLLDSLRETANAGQEFGHLTAQQGKEFRDFLDKIAAQLPPRPDKAELGAL